MALDLAKRGEKLTLSLTKKKIAKVVAQVATVYDRSGSMDSLYSDGTMQEYTNRMVPIGLKFDDNAQIDNWAFHNDSFPTGPITESNCETFVHDVIEKIRSSGTSYAPVLRDIEQHYFGSAVAASVKDTAQKAKGFLRSLFGAKDVIPDAKASDIPTSGDPVYLIFQTDGENDDKRETDRVLNDLKDKGIYIQFVGIGRESFSFIQEMADKYSNVGFIKINDLKNTSDEALYDLLINDEFVAFLKTKFPSNITGI